MHARARVQGAPPSPASQAGDGGWPGACGGGVSQREIHWLFGTSRSAAGLSSSSPAQRLQARRRRPPPKEIPGWRALGIPPAFPPPPQGSTFLGSHQPRSPFGSTFSSVSRPPPLQDRKTSQLVRPAPPLFSSQGDSATRSCRLPSSPVSGPGGARPLRPRRGKDRRSRKAA